MRRILEAEQERRQILEFQEKVDAAPVRVAVGDISKADIDELDAELADAMPQSVAARVPGFDTADNSPAAKAEFSATVNERMEATALSSARSPIPQI